MNITPELANISQIIIDSIVRNEHRVNRIRLVIVQSNGFWFGPHYSKVNHRVCFGLGLISLCIVFKNGFLPHNNSIKQKVISQLTNDMRIAKEMSQIEIEMEDRSVFQGTIHNVDPRNN